MSTSSSPLTDQLAPLAPSVGSGDLTPSDTTPAAITPAKPKGLSRLKMAIMALQGLGSTMAAASGNEKPLQDMENQQQQDFEDRRQTEQDTRAAGAQELQGREAQARIAEENAQTAEATKRTANIQTPEQIQAAALQQKAKELALEQQYAKPAIQSDAQGNLVAVNPSTATATPIHEAVQVNPKTITPPSAIGDLFPNSGTQPISVTSEKPMSIMPKMTGGVDMQGYIARRQARIDGGEDPVNASKDAYQDHLNDLLARAKARPNSLLEKWNLFNGDRQAYDEFMRGNTNAKNDQANFMKAEGEAAKVLGPLAALDPDYQTKLGAETQRQLQMMDNAAQSAESKRGSGPVTATEAKAYLNRAGGDKNKARQLARQDGRTF